MSMEKRADELFEEHKNAIHRRTDRTFAGLMTIQYLGGILAALIVSPLAWEGQESKVHLHVWMAAGLGFVISSFPVALALFLPGRTITRHAIAIGQMLFSALLIHLMGGRIETHFHVFGSLAFLGFYRDWRVLVSASLVVAIDHYLRGVYWPESVYGIATPGTWRWLEHTAWVLFEDLFLFIATHLSIREMREMASKRASVEALAEERSRHVAQLEQKERDLSFALQAKDTFLSICSHELRTPLTALKLESQLMSRTSAVAEGEIAKEKVTRFSGRITSQVDRLARLVEDMLDVSRLRLGKLSLNRENVELCELVRQVVRNVTHEYPGGCSLVEESGGKIHGNWDPFRIEQVLTNLVGNACKYGGGRPIEVAVGESGGTAYVSVRDRGEGIAKADQEKIFERFERVTTNSATTGLGLGLYISRGIVAQHGGKIRLVSELGAGSEFTMELPLSRGASLPGEPDLPVPSPASQTSAGRKGARSAAGDYLSK